MSENEIKNVENTNTQDAVSEESSVSDGASISSEGKIDLVTAKEDIERHLIRLVEFIKYYKNKDSNILALTKELQQYRNGFEYGLFKAFAQNLISYREECRRTVRNFGSHKLTKEEGVKYLGFMVQEYEDLLQNVGIEDNNGRYLYNGKDLSDENQEVVFHDVPEFEIEKLPIEKIDTTDDLVSYLQKCENIILKAIQDTAIIDSIVADYISATKLYENGVHQVILYPIIRQIISVYHKLTLEVKNLQEIITDDSATEFYISELNTMIEQSDELLSLCGVIIDGFVSDTFDPKKQRVMKLINTENAELVGKVVERYTDCYLLNDKVIYPSKVDVYKLK